MLRRGLCVRWVAALLLGLQGAACAGHRVNPPKGLAPGDRVRVTTRDGGTIVGRAVALQHDTLVLETDRRATHVSVAAGTVERLDVRTGTHGHAGLGLLVGVLVGGGAGLAVALSPEDDYCTPFYQGCGGPAVPPEMFIVPALVLGGMLLGTIVGAASRGDNWTAVPGTAIAQGWSYTRGPAAPDSVVPDTGHAVPPHVGDDGATPRVTLAPHVRLMFHDSAVVDVRDGWVSLDSVGGFLVGGDDPIAPLPVAFVRSQVARVMAPRGRRGHSALGLGIGFTIGIAVGALVGGFNDYAKVGAAVGAPVGAVLGLIIGGQIQSDAWVVIDLDPMLRNGTSP